MNAAGETRARGLLFDALAVLVILAVCVSLLHPVLLGGKVMSASHWWLRHGPFPQETVLQGVGGLDQFGDQMMQFVPWLKYAADAYAQDGRIPLWKTTALCGAPFVGNAQSAVWYPTNFVSIVLGAPEWMLAIGTLFKLFIGAVGAWLLARHLGISRLASLACGLAFGIGGSRRNRAGAASACWRSSRGCSTSRVTPRRPSSARPSPSRWRACAPWPRATPRAVRARCPACWRWAGA
jgi:hypothetical protein